jgi:CRISPR-associated protein Csb3
MNGMMRIPVDLTNPGQFFACCGLFELAARKWPGATARFDDCACFIESAGLFSDLLNDIHTDTPVVVDPTTPVTSPLWLAKFGLRLDWWNDELGGGKSFKTWAGNEKIVSKALEMHATFTPGSFTEPNLLTSSSVLDNAPFYFDACRVAQAKSIDVGFSTDAHNMVAPTCAGLEYLCLIGLQRFRPLRCVGKSFRYSAWRRPLLPMLASVAASGMLTTAHDPTHEFQLLFRTKYLKGFMPATQIGEPT